MHAAAKTAGGLVDVREDALILQGQRRSQAGDAAADDRDPRSAGRARRLRKESGPATATVAPHSTRALQELAARKSRASGCPVPTGDQPGALVSLMPALTA
jgi:hypothetical protein